MEQPAARGRAPQKGQNVTLSVVVPVYNRERMVAGAVASALAQEGVDAAVEVIVVDDASGDRSGHVAAEAGACVITLPSNSGPSGARNAGIDAATGDWVAFLDSDDRWAPWHVRTLLAASDGVDFVAATGLTETPKGLRALGAPAIRTVEVRTVRDLLRPENSVHTSSVMVRTEALRAAGGFSGSRFSEDLDLWIRLLGRGRGRVLPALTVYSSSHEGQTSRRNHTSMHDTALTLLEEAVRDGGLGPGALSSFETVLWWDDVRARCSAAETLRVAARQPRRWAGICRLLASRASQRHRWRLQRPLVEPLLSLRP